MSSCVVPSESASGNEIHPHIAERITPVFKRSIAFFVCLVFLCVCQGAHGQGKENDGLFPVVQGGKWGYIDRSGKIAIKPQFDAAYPFYDDVAKVMIGIRFENAKWSYIDKSGKIISQEQTSNRLEDFSKGLGAACLDRKDEIGYLCGYMDSGGRWAIEPKFYSAMSFHEGLARVAIRDKTSKLGTREVYIDKTGNVAIELSSVPARGSERFSEGLASFSPTVSVEGRYLSGFMDKTGKIVIEPKFEAVDDFSEGLAAVFFFKPAKHPTEANQEDYDAGFIDKTGKMVIKPQFEYNQPFSEGLAFVLIRGRMGAIDKTGRAVIRPQFYLHKEKATPYFMILDYYKQSKPWTFSEGLAAVHRGGKWGYVDKTGIFVIKPQFDGALTFSGGLALVVAGDRLGYIDKTGKYVWNPSR